MRTDKICGGMAGKILRVDLSREKTWTEDTEPYAREWLGGRALNSYLLFEEMNPQTKWSDPENLLIFGAGALVGTLAPGACRVSIETKNVFSGGKGSANVGGHFGPEMKFAGFDHMVITGKADRPVYLYIHNGQAEIRDARSIWGKTVFETEEWLEKELAPARIRIAAIGPAGENRVKGSGVVVDRAKVAGGSGVGCVMGDKRLKAVVACGQGGSVTIADPTRFFPAVDEALRKVLASPLTEMMRKTTLAGRWGDPDSPNWNFLISSRNGQDDYWDREKRVKLANPESGFPKYRRKISACFMCPAGCMPFSEVPEGKYAGTKGEGFWSNTVMDAVRLDITDPAGILKAWILANDLGLDTDFATSVSAFAFECYEKGILSDKGDGWSSPRVGKCRFLPGSFEKDCISSGDRRSSGRRGKGRGRQD